MSNDPIISIRRQWNDYRIASVRLSHLSELHWSICSGGVMARTPQPFIYGLAWCHEIEGDIAHSCTHGEGSHHIKVCIVKKDNPQTFQRLLDIVGPKPPT